MDRIVKKGLASFGVTKEGLHQFIANTFVPLVREIRQVVNARFGEVVNVTDDYTITERDEVVVVETDGGTIIITLPPVIGWTKHLVLKRMGSNTVFVQPDPTDTTNGVRIDGGLFATISTNKYAKTFVSNGSTWYLATQV